MSKAWFITGASSGLGRKLTELALSEGDRVTATVCGASRTIGSRNQACIVQSDVSSTPRNGADNAGSRICPASKTTSMRRSGSAGQSVCASVRRSGRTMIR